MANCDLSGGWSLEGCISGVGGVKKAYIANFDKDAEFTDGQIPGLTGSAIVGATTSATYYEINQVFATAEFIETPTKSIENQTFYVEQSVTLVFHKMTPELRDLVTILSKGRLSIIVESNSGDMLLVGKELGSYVSAGTGGLGKALGDLNGVTLTFTAQEENFADFIDPSIVGAGLDFDVAP